MADRDHSNGVRIEFMFFKTDEGIQHDADMDGDHITYTGNCQWADSLEEAMEEIDELVGMEQG